MVTNARSLGYRFAAALALALSACTVGPPKPAPGPLPEPERPCEAACGRMAELGCPGAEGSPEGRSCADVCREIEASDVGRFCPVEVSRIKGKAGECDEAELSAAFEACE